MQEKRLRELPYNKVFTIDVIHDRLSSRQTDILFDLQSICLEAGANFQIAMDKTMTDYRETEGREIFTLKMQSKMHERNHTLPIFIAKAGPTAQNFLDNKGFGNCMVVSDDNVLLIFELPQLLSRYWYVGGDHMSTGKTIEVSGGCIPWGIFYGKMVPVIWDEIYAKNHRGLLSFRKINDDTQHEYRSYYYLWEVKRR